MVKRKADSLPVQRDNSPVARCRSRHDNHSPVAGKHVHSRRTSVLWRGRIEQKRSKTKRTDSGAVRAAPARADLHPPLHWIAFAWRCCRCSSGTHSRPSRRRDRCKEIQPITLTLLQILAYSVIDFGASCSALSASGNFSIIMRQTIFA